MAREIQPTKTEKILLILTAAFLCGLLALMLHVHSTGAAGSYTVETEQTATASEIAPEASPVNINTADAEELATLPGIGEKLAERIVKYRADNGDFSTVDDLANVNGIGEVKLEDLRDYATVGSGTEEGEAQS